MVHRVLVTGSRDWVDRNKIEADILALHNLHGADLVIVHGDCPTGADRMAKEFCLVMDIKQESHPADWDTYGRAAGPKRNAKMVALSADLCLAYPLGNSRGTRGCMELARNAGIPVLNQS